jgi:hypothetical protein
LEQTAAISTKKPPILTIVGGATLVLSLFTPLFLLTLPIMATVGLCIAAAFRRETPRAAPYIVGAFAVLFLVWAHVPHGLAPAPLSNAVRYKSATWEYGSAVDPMRKTTSKWATLDSPTELNFAAPYEGDNRAEIEISASGYILTVLKGQFVCNSPDGTVAINFDGGPVERYGCSEPSDGTSTTLYINDWSHDDPGNNSKFLSVLMAKAKTMTIEAEFYGSGPTQMVFNIAGLDRSKL